MTHLHSVTQLLFILHHYIHHLTITEVHRTTYPITVPAPFPFPGR
jgi:hypothetical protein